MPYYKSYCEMNEIYENSIHHTVHTKKYAYMTYEYEIDVNMINLL